MNLIMQLISVEGAHLAWLNLAFAPAAQPEEIAADQRANLPTEQ